MGKERDHGAIVDSGCTQCLIYRSIVEDLGVRIVKLRSSRVSFATPRISTPLAPAPGNKAKDRSQRTPERSRIAAQTSTNDTTMHADIGSPPGTARVPADSETSEAEEDIQDVFST